ncbi:hypothetical protein G7084_00060 [Weissella coleopterorum]|uniref:Uncharacterized protein n=1 Tax=Weissella coleopterorum TaxID=2714949 RepID=A0A6G8AXS3_9LACO|nr:phage tail tube assembly chaperone [Weissella coleopterorum]QIL49854.1 hypothetical protein G7084_00060 [Weissella coleopterorum]
MNIKIKELRSKPYAVKASIKNLKKAYGFQYAVATLQDNDGTQTEAESIKQIIDLQNTVINFVIEILNLKEKEQGELEELEFETVTNIAMYISMRISGMSDEEINGTKSDEDEGLQ